MHAPQLPRAPAGLDLSVRWFARRGVSRTSAPDDYRRRQSGKRHPPRDRAGKTKDADRLCLHRSAAGDSFGLPDDAEEKRPPVILRARREMDRAPQLVLSNQQTFAAVPEDPAYLAGLLRR